MASKRSYGTGSLAERPVGSGSWTFRYVVGKDPVTGKLRRNSATIKAKTKSAARARANQILAEVDVAPLNSKATLNQLFAEWMGFLEGRGRSPKTISGYQSVIDHHLAPAFGAIPIHELTPHHLDSFYAKCTASRSSPRTVRNINAVIRSALNQAIRWGWIDRNPAALVTLPEPPSLKIEAPDPAQAAALLAGCFDRDERLGAFVFLASVTGCRRGEIAALRWSSLSGSSLRVTHSAYQSGRSEGLKTPKSGRERQVQLAPSVVQWLAEWRTRCEVRAEEFGVTLEESGFVISDWPDGSKLIRMDRVTHAFRTVADSLGMPQFHLHSLRHFVATELLAAGLSATDTAEMLGHADPSITLRVYAHATQPRQIEAARTMADVVTPPSLKEPSEITEQP
jgi:integrase